MTPTRPEALAPYLEHLRRLPFIRTAEASLLGQAAPDRGFDAVLRLETPRGPKRLYAEVKRTNFGHELANHLASRLGRPSAHPVILLAPYVPAQLGRYLEERGVNFVDSVGNCFVSLGPSYIACVEGRRRPARDVGSAGIRAPGYQVLFALFARPELANAPVRTLAERAGVGKSAAAQMLRRLESEGHLGRTKAGRQLLERQRLLERWLTGYADVLRPSLSLGRFRTPDSDPGDLEARCESALGRKTSWAWSGGAAAFRLAGHYRGEDSVLCIAELPADLLRRLKVLPAKDGPLTILRCKGTLALEGAKPRTVHPLLVYAELLAHPSERAGEAAEEIREKYLELAK